MDQTCVSPRRHDRRRRGVGSVAGALLGGCGLLVAAGMPAHAVTIVPTFDSSITGSAYASTIESAINQAVGFYRLLSNPISVSIDYELAPANAQYLGASASTFYLSGYANYAASLGQDAAANSNQVAATAYAHLSSGNAADQIRATSANFRALGFNAAGNRDSSGGSGGTFDGVILLNASYLLGFSGTGSYAPTETIQHETDEVLGIGGSGSVLNIMQQYGLTAAPTATINNTSQTYIGPLDLYRYAAPGTPSLTTSGTAAAYFSINGGATNLVPFNQDSRGDYADWGAAGCTPLVQQAFSCSTSNASLTPASPEVTALQAIGYNLPEPGSLPLLGSAVIGLALLRRGQSARTGGPAVTRA